ncbi:hypothetical protein MKQ68_19115 [Chitinophaga horti]|uniref:Uncharacterized protein n=1 Tax=Chitinophaga horti TaxID=2920382 RepID=A0ABY6J1G2_9BACT|nr:hypothetical protein [Chitinophaga horti]UYQ92201.1 hypothetical protein MKQ68_19115 [Chitinophaga horti]
MAFFKEKVWPGMQNVWRDPVWSKLISTGIITAVIFAWAKITQQSWGDIYGFVLRLLTFPVPPTSYYLAFAFSS